MIILPTRLRVVSVRVHLFVRPIVQTYVRLHQVAIALDVVLGVLVVDRPALQVVTEDVLVIVLNFVLDVVERV